MLENIGLIISVIILAVARDVVSWYKKKKETNDKPIQFLKAMEAGAKINILLDEIKDFTRSQRVHILGYHNGNVGYNGVSFSYISMLYEEISLGYESFMGFYQRMPCGKFADLIFKLHKEEMVYIPENDTSYMGIMHKAYGIKCAYKFRIGDSIANGSLSVSFHDKETKLSETQLDKLKIYILKLDELLKVK